ncbi:sulfotransferase domain-containing protein [Pseudokineococcus sp. 1T1Z-3]|uniref:sulfotransferase domain-containing protein n=1 Tax=Pseudokineococcus sp. 1T1Z-3 TaxID=3132745 RepID=UPI00309C7CA5
MARPPHPDAREGAAGALSHLGRKVVRHVRWARTEGVGRLVEEDRLDPRERLRTAWRAARWRARHGGARGEARPVYVVGLQRSGTNMLLRGVDAAPEVQALGEGDRRVMRRYRLVDQARLVRVVRASRHPVVLLKPLCDSQHVDRLLDSPDLPGGRALWVYREPLARARSEVSKFGSSNLLALQAISTGHGTSLWQGERLPAASVDLVRTFDVEAMTPLTAAVLFWVVRNRLVLDLGLAQREDVLLVSYDAVVADPAVEVEKVCTFVGLAPDPALWEHVEARRTHPPRVDVDPAVLALAHALHAQLEELRVATVRP